MKQTPAHTFFNRELLALMPDKAHQVVEIGCMLGNFAQAYRQINPECHYTGIDIDPGYECVASRMIALTRNGIRCSWPERSCGS
jgi:tRNA G46 methylase TrmB